MVTIGTLEWSVQVNNAAEAKEQAEQVETSVRSASESAGEADSKVGGLAGRFKGLADAEKKAGAATDKMNAKMGFMGTAIMGALSSLMAMVTGIAALKAILIGAGVIASIALFAVAFKENWAGIRDHTMNFIEWLKGALQGLKETALAIWESFMSGFEESGATLKDLEVIYAAFYDGIAQGLADAWTVIEPIVVVFGKILIELAGIVGMVVGTIVKWLANMEKEFGIISFIVEWVVKLIAIFAAAYVIVQVIVAIVAAFISLAGTIMYVAGVVAALIAALNPITLAILAIIAVIIALYVAWKTNFLGIRDITNDIISEIMAGWEWLKSGTKKAIAKTIDLIVGPFKKAYNMLVGNSIIPNMVNSIVNIFSGATGAISGAVDAVVQGIIAPFESAHEMIKGIVESITDMASSVSDAAGNMADSIPGSDAAGNVGSAISNNVPSLDSGGLVKQDGLAQIHKGEAVVPADVTKEAVKEGAGSGGGDQPIKVNVGGIEVGDQAIDLSKLTRTEKKRLAELIAEKLGDEVRNSVS